MAYSVIYRTHKNDKRGSPTELIGVSGLPQPLDPNEIIGQPRIENMQYFEKCATGIILWHTPKCVHKHLVAPTFCIVLDLLKVVVSNTQTSECKRLCYLYVRAQKEHIRQRYAKKSRKGQENVLNVRRRWVEDIK